MTADIIQPQICVDLGRIIYDATVNNMLNILRHTYVCIYSVSTVQRFVNEIYVYERCGITHST